MGMDGEHEARQLYADRQTGPPVPNERAVGSATAAVGTFWRTEKRLVPAGIQNSDLSDRSPVTIPTELLQP
jgi:hypothetical protein